MHKQLKRISKILIKLKIKQKKNYKYKSSSCYLKHLMFHSNFFCVCVNDRIILFAFLLGVKFTFSYSLLFCYYYYYLLLLYRKEKNDKISKQKNVFEVVLKKKKTIQTIIRNIEIEIISLSGLSVHGQRKGLSRFSFYKKSSYSVKSMQVLIKVKLVCLHFLGGTDILHEKEINSVAASNVRMRYFD